MTRKIFGALSEGFSQQVGSLFLHLLDSDLPERVRSIIFTLSQFIETLVQRKQILQHSIALIKGHLVSDDIVNAISERAKDESEQGEVNLNVLSVIGMTSFLSLLYFSS